MIISEAKVKADHRSAYSSSLLPRDDKGGDLSPSNNDTNNENPTPQLNGIRHGADFADRMTTLGEVTYLAMQSPLHMRYSVAQLALFFVTPLRLGQCRVYRNKSGPVGFVAWARLSDAASADYTNDVRELTPLDWTSGTNLWFIEFLAPFGHSRRIVNDMRRSIFPISMARALKRDPNGGPSRIVEWRGVNYQPV